MKSVILILTLFFCIRTLLSAENGVISGKLYNEQTNKPVAYANLIVKDSYLGASSDESGTFTIQLPAGKYILQIYHVVYYPKEIPVTVTPGQKVCLSIALEEKTEQLGVITVQAERNAAPSHFALKPYSVINAPAVGEPDVVRVAAMLPGIMQNNDYRAELNIRGGHADQTQFLLDGIEVFHPQHLQGMFGAFNLWAMENIDIYTARFPAEYAGRLSGIIALESKRPTKEAYTKANLSLLSMGLALTRQWGNTSLLFAARRTYLDLIARMLNSKISYNFYDLNFKLQQKLGQRWWISALGFINKDNQEAAQSTSDWGNRMAALKIEHKGTRSRHALQVSYSTFFSQAGDTKNSSNIRNDLSLSVFSYNYQNYFPKSILKAGLDYKNYEAVFDWLLNEAYNPDNIFYPGAPAVFYDSRRVGFAEAWFEQSFLFWPRLPFTVKFRYISQQLNKGYFAPGLQLDWKVANRFTVLFGTERAYQFVAAGAQGLEFSTPSPLFLLDKPLSADLLTLGGLYLFGLDFRLKAEGFYKRFNSIVRLNENSLTYPDFMYGSGSAYGAELVFEKLRGRITFQLSYAYSDTRVKFNSATYKPAWDIPHAFKGLVGFRFGRTWLFNAAFTYRSGNLYQNALAMFYAAGSYGGHDYSRTDYGQIVRYFIYENHPTARFSPYTRLDIALRKKYKAKYFDWMLYLQVQNITVADNPLRIDYQERYFGGTPSEEEGMDMSIPILPSVGAEFEF